MRAILKSFPRSCCEKSGVTGKSFFSSSAPCWELMLSHYYLGMLTLVNTVLALFWRSLNYGML